MITIEVRVNGSIISAFTVVNRGPVGTSTTDYIYEYQGVKFPLDNRGPPTIFNGELWHHRPEGTEVLIRELFKDITK